MEFTKVKETSREDKIKYCQIAEEVLEENNQISYEFLDDKPLEKWYSYYLEEMHKAFTINK